MQKEIRIRRKEFSLSSSLETLEGQYLEKNNWGLNTGLG
jgi:hypothetical protein